jgi:hypothetical protein
MCSKPASVERGLELAVDWYRAAPEDTEAWNWLSQAFYSRALARDGLRLPCASETIYIDRGGPSHKAVKRDDSVDGVIEEAQHLADSGWGHILLTQPAREDAERALCLADGAFDRQRDWTAFQRGLRILLDLGRDEELRARIRRVVSQSLLTLEEATSMFEPYVVDYLGVARETQAGELLLVLHQLAPADHKLEAGRKAVLTLIRKRYPEGSPTRIERERWLSENKRFAEPWK